MTTPCQAADPRWFDSITWTDHLVARRSCAVCPATVACIAEAVQISNTGRGVPDGTWGGVLWRDGGIIAEHEAGQPPAKCGTDAGWYRHRSHLHEPACEPCARAHNSARAARNRAKARAAG